MILAFSINLICLAYACPPYTVAVLIPKNLPNLYSSSDTCIASSLVGTITTASTPDFPLSLFNIGSPNAAVLPVPVCACPTISLPAKITGIACSCIGLGSLKPASSIAFCNCSLKSNSLKVIFLP